MDHAEPIPASCRARHASPASRKLVGEKTALVATAAALMMNPSANRMAAMTASMVGFPPVL
jgi:hypothetical protein